MAEDYVQVAPDSSGKKVKTLIALDTSGNTVEIQAIVLTDDSGWALNPLSESTGQEMIKVLQKCERHLARLAKSL